MKFILTSVKLLKENLLLIFLVCFILLVSSKVCADTAHINYVTSQNAQYLELKSELKDLGYSVTGTTSGSVTLSVFSTQDLPINISGK